MVLLGVVERGRLADLGRDRAETGLARGPAGTPPGSPPPPAAGRRRRRGSPSDTACRRRFPDASPASGRGSPRRPSGGRRMGPSRGRRRRGRPRRAPSRRCRPPGRWGSASYRRRTRRPWRRRRGSARTSLGAPEAPQAEDRHLEPVRKRRDDPGAVHEVAFGDAHRLFAARQGVGGAGEVELLHAEEHRHATSLSRGRGFFLPGIGRYFFLFFAAAFSALLLWARSARCARS